MRAQQAGKAIGLARSDSTRSRLSGSSVRARIGAALAAFFLFASAVQPAKAEGLIRDAEIEDTLRVWGEPLWEAAGLQPEDVSIYILDDPSINAFVAGGQNIFMHTGLLMAANRPNEIIGVMAHETGHISGGHSLRRREAMRESMGPAWISIGLGVLLVAAGAPDAGAALISSSGNFAMGNLVRHTQAEEASADQAAVGFLEATDQSGEGLITFFNREFRPYEYLTRRAPPYLVTHPYPSDRVEALRRRVAAQPHYEAVDSDDYMRRFRFMQAKLVGFITPLSQTLATYPESDTSQPARYARAVAYYRVSDLDSARAELDLLVAEDPNNAYFQELYGQILFENNRAEEAIGYYRRSVELAPEEPLLIIGLARALVAGQGREGADEAIRLLQHAVSLEPDNAFAWRELASARELRGERGLAELASAEQNYSVGNYPLALNFAERARRNLSEGTVAYQRALDITNFASSELRERQTQRQ